MGRCGYVAWTVVMAASERPAVIQGPSNRMLSKMGMFHFMDYQRAVDEW